MDKTAGPVHVGRVGAAYRSGSVLLLADVEASGGGLHFGTKGLGAEISLNNPGNPTFHLDGLSLGYSRPPLTIAGALVRRNMGKDYSLAVGGMAVVQTPAVNVTAMGFYAQKISGDPSLFCFGVLDLSRTSAGPPMFRLEKLAAGFGYHTQVRTPHIAEVRHFPFVKMLTATESVDDPLKQLDILLGGGWVTPASGEMWLAAGMEALVYELVDVSGVAIVQFGNELVAGLYGHAVAQFPKRPAMPWAELAVDVRAEYRSSSDALEIDAAVTDTSFVLDRNCKLTGGAAVRLWFGRSAHPGEFVVSVGGYHPKFVVPPHYPRPARLGFDWHLSDAIHAWGSCYAALTPHAFMAGINANLHGQWDSASVDASVYADALVEWDPFYFKVDWGGRISGTVWGITAEVGADGHVWGPPVGGVARVKIGRFGINVDFGADDPGDRVKLSPQDFRDRMLPGGIRPHGAPAAAGTAGSQDAKVVTLTASMGLLPSAPVSGTTEQTTAPAAGASWAFGVQEFACRVTTAVPLTSVRVNEVDILEGITRKTLDIRPMKATGISSSMKITVKHKETEVAAPVGPVPADSSMWGATLDVRGVPAALWDTTPMTFGGSGLVGGYASAITLTPPPASYTRKSLIPAKAVRRRSSIGMVAEKMARNYTCKNNDRLPAMSEKQLANVSATTAKQTRIAFLEALKALDIPGFSMDNLTQGLKENVFENGASGYVDALPQILEG
ncbi:DUF6603 domain-containing protein [Streptomyces sp. NPDC059003]|uniref:DUF6603 domain-containing protein n=1 Tax=Streptomyces sp. NPDC059003 TaxID=3346691 RepID=UPI0036B6385F